MLHELWGVWLSIARLYKRNRRLQASSNCGAHQLHRLRLGSSRDLTVPDSEPYRADNAEKHQADGITLDDMGQPYGGIAGYRQGMRTCLYWTTRQAPCWLADATVNYRNGTITLAGIRRQAEPARVYRAEGDWQVRVKAFERYTQQDDRVNTASSRSCPGKASSVPLDAGKSFSVDYVWVDDALITQ